MTALVVLAAQLGADVHVECPECGHHGPHATNGSSYDPSALCSECGLCFDLGEVEDEPTP